MVQISACKKDLEIANLSDYQAERHSSAAVLRSTTTNPFLDDPHFRNLVRLTTRDNQLVHLFLEGHLDTTQIWGIMEAAGIDPYTFLPVGHFHSDSTMCYLDTYFPAHPVNAYFEEIFVTIDSFYNTFAEISLSLDSGEVVLYLTNAFETIISDMYLDGEVGLRSEPDPCANCHSLYQLCLRKAESSAASIFVGFIIYGVGATIVTANPFSFFGSLGAGGISAGMSYASDRHNCKLDIDYCLSSNGCPPCTNCGSGGGGGGGRPNPADMQKQ